MAKDEQQNKAAFTHERLPVQFDNLNQTPVKQDDGAAAWHDAARFIADVDDEELREILDHMQVSRRALDALEAEQVWSIALKGCTYYEHYVALWVSTVKVFELQDATVYGFTVSRAAGNQKYRLTFSVKGIPTEAQHHALEAARLDGVTGQLFAVSVRSNAAQGELVMGVSSDDDSGDD